MEQHRSLSDPDGEAAHLDQIRNDLTIIQAHAQLMLRRLDAGRLIDVDDMRPRLLSIVDAVHRLDQMHR